MSNRQKWTLWPVLMVLLAGLSMLVVQAARTRERSDRERQPSSIRRFVAKPNQAGATGISIGSRQRNLSLQPAALRLSRKLGQRFTKSPSQVTVMTGTLTTGTERQAIQITRRQNDGGEQLEIALAGGTASLVWSNEEGAKAVNRNVNQTERMLIERLTFDSADQFVLAQLRGASYYTVARNVRPTGAGENYQGPLWDIVRVHDPEKDPGRKPFSTWRLYYINTRTGLIDRIVCDLQGEPVEAKFAGWTAINGEKAPARINWIRRGEVVMELNLTSFLYSPQA